MKKIIILRPGALGDVLVLHGPIGFMKQAFPGATIGLGAPGERGRFLCRPGLADQVFDWEGRDCSWLFSRVGEAPAALAEFFADADLVIAYFAPNRNDTDLSTAIGILAPNAAIVFHPSAPPGGSGICIGEWLARAAYPAADRHMPKDKVRFLAAVALAGKIPVAGIETNPIFAADPPSGSYAVMHPGSGSARKNWGCVRFAELGRLLMRLTAADGKPFLDELWITAGEADGDLGAELLRLLPGARLLTGPNLESLAALLAGARLYVGNDSGVSHLAGAVGTRDGRSPLALVLFGPSDSAIWKPAGATAVETGPDMSAVSPVEVSTLAGNLLQKSS